MTREIGPELVARIRHVADSLEAIARGEVDSPQPFAAAYAVYLNGEYDSSYGPDAIDEAMEIAADCNGDVVPLYRTPQTNATPGECSVLGSYEESDEKRRVLYTKQEPVAWAVVYPTGDAGVLCFFKRDAEERATASDRVVPLYRQPKPTLTDEEREAIEVAAAAYADDHGERFAATLRSLLERLNA